MFFYSVYFTMSSFIGCKKTGMLTKILEQIQSKIVIIGLIAGICFQSMADELSIPRQCHNFLYSDKNKREFSCCSTIFYEEDKGLLGQDSSLKYINLKFYARILSTDITVEDLLKLYFSFDKWDEYALYNENSNIVFNYSIGVPPKFSSQRKTLTHRAHYTIYSTPILGQMIPYEIKEHSTYIKRIPPASGAVASYDFSLTKNSTSMGLLDKKGYVHVAKDNKKGLLLFSKFFMSPGAITGILPRVVINSMNFAFENLLKGMIGVDYGCKKFIEEYIP